MTFIPCITLPTCITSHSATLTNHIMVRLPKNKIQCKFHSGNLLGDITDHLANFTLIDLNIKHQNYQPYIRLFTPNKMAKLNQNIDNKLHTNNVNLIYEDFFKDYKILLDKYFPFVRLSRKKAKEKPWITDGIKASIKIRDKLFEEYHKNKSKENEDKWKLHRNKLLDIIRKSETAFYKEQITSQNNSCNQMWKLFGKILKNKHNTTQVTKLKFQDKTLTKPNDISEAFNNYFTNIGKKLANKFEEQNPNNLSHNKYLNDPITNKIQLSSISPGEIIDIINNLEAKKSSGHDNIPVNFLKLTGESVSKSLAKIFNLSITTGVYPSLLKIAKVTPIFKKGNHLLPNNYRPISVLGHINKIYEKLLFSRLSTHFNQNNLLYKYQYGFREGHSTTHALVELTDSLKNSIDNGNYACGIFIDLSKAFDTVNHDILIDKLKNYGISDNAIELMKSYLEDRLQYVEINKTKSSLDKVTCGVPQGSVLGPLLFLIYINDLPNCCLTRKVRIFADDTVIFFECDDPNQLSVIIEDILRHINDWFVANKLTMNIEKYNSCIFRSLKNKNKPIPESVPFNNYTMNRVPHIKYLGVFLDEHLSFTYHVNEVCKSLRKYFSIFYNIRRYLNKEHIKAIYYSMIYSKIQYGLLTFGLTTAKNIKKIQTLQNKLLKVLTNQKYRTPTNDLHNSLDILKVKDILTQGILCFVHKYVNKKLPNVFDNYFKKFNEIHNLNTRNKDKFIAPKHRTVLGSKTIKHMGAVKWNILNQKIKEIRNVKGFRIFLKKYYIPY